MTTTEAAVESQEASAAWGAFDKTTSRWGRITMIVAMVIMIGGPAILAAQIGVSPGGVLTGVVAVAAVYAVLWVVEPLSYFPILGAASMYQAFMIGNIGNKLLPAAIVAQSAIGAKPGTKRGQLASVLAIAGAAVTHLIALALFVGVLGSILTKLIPADIGTGIQTFILPALMGAVIVQMMSGRPEMRIVIIAIGVALVITFVLTPLAPMVAYFSTALSVVVTVLLALFLPGRRSAATVIEDPLVEDMS